MEGRNAFYLKVSLSMEKPFQLKDTDGLIWKKKGEVKRSIHYKCYVASESVKRQDENLENILYRFLGTQLEEGKTD